jgi:DNA-binding MurR/RpiR family transcriptional regulator
MSIVERVQTVAETLTPAERLLVKEVIAQPRDVALGTAGELARRIGVHEATASRLARKLGFPSYAGFRDAIRDEFIVKTDPALRVRNTLDTARGQALIENLVQQEIAALTQLPSYVGEDRLHAAAAALAGRRKIFIFARGNAETLGVLLNRRMRRMAYDTVMLTGDSRDLAEQILTIGPEDALVAFAFRRQPRHYGPLVEQARKVGAMSVIIAGSVGPSLTPAGDHLLSAPRSSTGDAFQTLTVPMTICNALILSIAQSDEARSLRHLEALGELIGEFERR